MANILADCMKRLTYTVLHAVLKGSYDVAKKNIIILCIWCNAMFMRFKVQKTHFPHTVLYCCSSMLRLKAHRSEKRGVL